MPIAAGCKVSVIGILPEKNKLYKKATFLYYIAL
jgi:hypothetical protein